jgi:hypothetical protein
MQILGSVLAKPSDDRAGLESAQFMKKMLDEAA